jgi:hypothetical protein
MSNKAIDRLMRSLGVPDASPAVREWLANLLLHGERASSETEKQPSPINPRQSQPDKATIARPAKRRRDHKRARGNLKASGV